MLKLQNKKASKDFATDKSGDFGKMLPRFLLQLLSFILYYSGTGGQLQL
jgi:hypothetical protein